MEHRLKIIADNKIPFLKGRIECLGEVEYADPASFTPQMVKDADILVVRTRTRCDASLLEGSSVRLVVTATIGTDHIDLDWCAANGITVRNAIGCNAPGVAQYVWSSLLRNGFDPRTDTLGIVGYGHVGSIVAGWGRMLGCRVLVCDPPRKKAGMKDVDYLGLEQLLHDSDAVSLHTPLTREGDDATYHLIGTERLEMLKRGAILINSSRGGVVDNAAWREHLREGRTKAIIDTWENEPGIDRELLAMATIATPHIAGYSLEGKQRATRMALEAIEEYTGVMLDKSGLEKGYVMPAAIATEEICSSYNPFADTVALRSAPEGFERLRGDYDYRKEPSFK